MKINYQGKEIASVYSVISMDDAEQLVRSQIGESLDVSLIELEAETEKERIGLIRRHIALSGDTDSLLGTTTDNTHLLLVEFSKLVIALDSVSSIEDIKSAAESFKNDAKDILSKIEEGSCIFPYLQKGKNQVLSEIYFRASEVSNALFKV